jgi:hypothetical protein
MRVKNRRLTRAWWLLMTLAGLALVTVCQADRGALVAPAVAAESRPVVAQTPAGQRADTDKREGATSVTRGMGKEAVRTAWGEPEEIRRIRTCFGWQEEWVYRGDPKRFGVSERVLLFDEGEVLTEIK